MKTSTIPPVTLGEEVFRLPSTTPSNYFSICFDLEGVRVSSLALTKDAEKELFQTSQTLPTSPCSQTIPHGTFYADQPKTSSSKTPSTPISKDSKLNAPATPPTTPETCSHKTPLDQILEKAPAQTPIKEAEQDAIQQLDTPPVTPPTRRLSFHTFIQTLEISPNSSSDRSIDSISTSSKPSSPNTQPSRSISLESPNPEPPKAAPPKQQAPCLQCHLARLRCSLSAPPKRRRGAADPAPKLCCSRCARSGESFCILQIAVETADPQYQLTSQMRETAQLQKIEQIYFARNADGEVVMEKAEAMLADERAKRRFELPRPSMWKLEKMKPGFGWFVDGSREEWRMVQEERFEGWKCVEEVGR